ncbi:MAG: TRAP transporter substrate-binding protein DctP [Proteobacteria bacterium]|nr:TRAP transporter substrate-binding protein DctP [Pseudomonadota bacterium]
MSPDNSVWSDMMGQLITPFFNEMFGRRMKLTTYFGGTRGDDDGIVDKIRAGKLDGCFCTNQGTVKAVPEMSVLSLPTLFRNYEEVDFIEGKLRKYIETTYEKQDLILLFLIDTGFLYFFSVGDPSALNSIRQFKIFSWFGEIQEKSFLDLGLNSFPVPVPELADSIITGKTNAGAGPAPWLLATHTNTYINYYLDFPWFYGVSTGFLDQKALQRIIDRLERNPRDFELLKKQFEKFQKEVTEESITAKLGLKDKHLLEAARKLVAWSRGLRFESPKDLSGILAGVFRVPEKDWAQSIRGFETQCLDGFEKRGMKKVRLAESDRARMFLTTARVWEEFSGRLYPAALLAGIRDRLTQFRAGKKEALE